MRMRYSFLAVMLFAAEQVFAQSDCGCPTDTVPPNCGAEEIYCSDFADSACCDTCDSCSQWFLFPQDPCGWNVRGWINGGFIGNTDDPDSKFNGPYNAVDRANEGMLNQMYG